jgi:hypothetical protein
MAITGSVNHLEIATAPHTVDDYLECKALRAWTYLPGKLVETSDTIFGRAVNVK